MSNSSKLVVAAGLLWALSVAAGCGKKEDDSAKPAGAGASAKEDAAATDVNGMPTEEQMAKQAEDTRKALAQMNGGKEIKAVEGKDLKALLPAEMGGAKRLSVESEHINQGGIDIATTKTTYEAEPAGGDAAAKPGYRVEITDIGNMSGTMTMGFVAWSMSQYDKETDTGYEKTTKHKGYPAMESYDRESKSGELQVFVAKRFVVKVSANDATIEQIRAAMDSIDLGKVAALAK